jgi:hypothetical protein
VVFNNLVMNGALPPGGPMNFFLSSDTGFPIDPSCP